MSEATHLAQMFDFTVVRVHVSAAETKGSRMQRISRLRSTPGGAVGWALGNLNVGISRMRTRTTRPSADMISNPTLLGRYRLISYFSSRSRFDFP